MRFELHPDALAEYEDAARYYAGCREGLEFDSLPRWNMASSRLLKFPAIGHYLMRISADAWYKYFLMWFFNSVETDHILILAAMHSHREPGYWRKRIAP